MLEKLFGFDSSTMTLRKEVIGGITTFLTMAYTVWRKKARNEVIFPIWA